MLFFVFLMGFVRIRVFEIVCVVNLSPITYFKILSPGSKKLNNKLRKQ
ncbi:hypothetical protein CHRY9293_01208 [Chryseobacterium potabilaquae]|uniref:Uncharacterized protein n=1 Tax=Chryseobacterium potabilaquae TaxID=2675057 RepID=A0A6N4X6C6_9FLAO|nr:hypothetical protein CHRY9293_01208 [Chryseobacterium potabilaquae]